MPLALETGDISMRITKKKDIKQIVYDSMAA